MYGSESSSDGGWISWFIELEGHEFFVEVSVPWPNFVVNQTKIIS